MGNGDLVKGGQVPRDGIFGNCDCGRWISPPIWGERHGDCSGGRSRAALTWIKQAVYPGECERARSNDHAGGDGAPKSVGASKLPDGEYRHDHGDKDAHSGCPEREPRDQSRVKVTSSFRPS